MNEDIKNKIVTYFDLNNDKTILDIGGCKNYKFSLSTIIIDMFEDKEKNIYKVDIDFEKFPFDNKSFYFSFCRHTLEDIQNPINAFNEIIRVSNKGYIETPSPLVELTKNVNRVMAGYNHHRYIFWSDKETNTLFFIPKYPMVELCLLNKKNNYILNTYPVYWNNYYIFDEKHKPNIFMFRHEINFNTDYINILNIAVNKSIEYSNYLVLMT